MPNTKPITQREAEYALDRLEFDALYAKWGGDTLLQWYYETKLSLPRQVAADLVPLLHGTIGEPNR